jgi:hypothetical protein
MRRLVALALLVGSLVSTGCGASTGDSGAARSTVDRTPTERSQACVDALARGLDRMKALNVEAGPNAMGSTTGAVTTKELGAIIDTAAGSCGDHVAECPDEDAAGIRWLHQYADFLATAGTASATYSPGQMPDITC